MLGSWAWEAGARTVMSVTALTSQVEIGPNSSSASAGDSSHHLTAPRNVLLSNAMSTTAGMSADSPFERRSLTAPETPSTWSSETLRSSTAALATWPSAVPRSGRLTRRLQLQTRRKPSRSILKEDERRVTRKLVNFRSKHNCMRMHAMDRSAIRVL